MPPPLTLAFVPTLLRLGAPTISATTQTLRPTSSTTTLPARRSLAFTDVPARRGLPQTTEWKSAQRYRHSASAREKISHANKGNIPWNKGRKHTDETRLKISQATRAAMERPQVRDKLRRIATGRKHSEETKRKIRTTSRMNRSSNAQQRIPRLPVPFTFDDATVAQLDARITKRYRAEYTDKSPGVSARGKRSMPLETRRKLSERIRALWAEDPSYRDRVAQGIEERARKTGKNGKSTLSEEHRMAISKSLRERYAKNRGEGPEKGTTRKPRARKSLSPTAGTRFDLDSMQEEDREALKERRRKASLAIEEAEAREANHEEGEDNYDVAQMSSFERILSEKETKRNRKKLDEAQIADRLLIESLASAGQLPSLEEECAMVGSSFLVGSSRQTELPYSYLSMSDNLFLEDEEPMEGPLLDPLLVPPEFERLGL